MRGIFVSLYHLAGLLRSQWLSLSDIEEIQNAKLGLLLKHAYENVGYYRQLFDSAGVKPEDIRDRKDLLRIPITTKRHLQSLPIEKITAKSFNPGASIKLRTSGSTGIPLEIILSTKDLRFRGAVLKRTILAHRCHPGDKVVHLTNHRSIYRRDWYEYLGIRRRYEISALSEMDDQIRRLKRIRPDILIGYPSGLLAAAETLKQKKVERIFPKLILSGGAILTPQAREFLNATFVTTTIDFYNSWEFGSIAWECKYQAGYHINADTLIVEVVQDGREALFGESGEIVVTALDSYAMPFIRYHLGDIGVLSDRRCPCGRGLPLLEKLEGRTNDYVKLPNGKRIMPATIVTALSNIPGISQFQFVQEEKDQCRIYLINREKSSPGAVEHAKEK